jgi:hypothetical protein
MITPRLFIITCIVTHQRTIPFKSVSVDEAFILWILKMENIRQTINTLKI